jgi:hypothetical protein
MLQLVCVCERVRVCVCVCVCGVKQIDTKPDWPNYAGLNGRVAAGAFGEKEGNAEEKERDIESGIHY